VAATKARDRLRLYVDGRLVGQSEPFHAAQYHLTSKAPLHIGFGQNDSFLGRLADVRIYSRALSTAEVERLAAGR
jgi:hypothetical protein